MLTMEITDEAIPKQLQTNDKENDEDIEMQIHTDLESVSVSPALDAVTPLVSMELYQLPPSSFPNENISMRRIQHSSASFQSYGEALGELYTSDSDGYLKAAYAKSNWKVGAETCSLSSQSSEDEDDEMPLDLFDTSLPLIPYRHQVWIIFDYFL
jgi:hypothetical protein